MATPEEDVLREMAGLLGAMTDARLDDAGRRRLAQLVREEPEARRLYLDYCQMHALLRSAHGVLTALEPPEAPASEACGLDGGRRRRTRLGGHGGVCDGAGGLADQRAGVDHRCGTRGRASPARRPADRGRCGGNDPSRRANSDRSRRHGGLASGGWDQLLQWTPPPTSASRKRRTRGKSG